MANVSSKAVRHQRRNTHHILIWLWHGTIEWKCSTVEAIERIPHTYA